MNKSILIVICDFMIVSILSLAKFEGPSQENSAPQQDVEVVQTFSDSQMVDLLKMSLDKEKLRREELDADISRLSESVKQSSELSEKQKQLLAVREKEIAQLAGTKQGLEKEKQEILGKASDLEKRLKIIDDRNATLHSEIVGASKKLDESNKERVALEKKLGDMREVDSASQEKLKSLQDELLRNRQNLDNLKTESEKLKNENRAMEMEKNALSTQLEVAATKSQIYEENLKRVQALVEIEKTEKQKIQEHADVLAVGVGELAASQQKLSKDIGDLRPMTASEIFETAKENLLRVSIKYTQKGLLGSTESTDDVKCVCAAFGDKLWIVFNADGTILKPTPSYPAPIPEALGITVFGKTFKFSPRNFLGVMQDPRLIAIPVPTEFVEKEKLKVYEFPQGAFKFSECVVIDAKRLYYGQTPFKVDGQAPNYAEMDVGLFQSIFGDFSPSKTDIVFSRTGELLGYMLNSSSAIMLREFTTLNSISLGDKFEKNSYSAFMLERANRLRELPFKFK